MSGTCRSAACKGASFTICIVLVIAFQCLDLRQKINQETNVTKSAALLTRTKSVFSFRKLEALAFTNLTVFDAPSKQQTMFELAAEIASHDYQTFNDDIQVHGFTFKAFSPQLLLQTFANKTFLFFGDSTTLKFYSFLVFCLNVYVNRMPKKFTNRGKGFETAKNAFAMCDFNRSLFNVQYSDQKPFLASMFPSTVSNIGFKSMKAHFPSLQTTLYGMRRWPKDMSSEKGMLSFYDSFLRLQPKPDILVFNPSSLHLLHLLPHRPFERNAFDIALHFNTHLRKIYSVAMQLKSKCLVYRGQSPICYAKDNGDYSTLRQAYVRNAVVEENGHNNNNNTGNANNTNMNTKTNTGVHDNVYKKYMQDCERSYHSPELCQNWTFINEGGIRTQNALMVDFVRNISASDSSTSTTMNDSGADESASTSVYFYDRFNIFHRNVSKCATEALDAVHWIPTYGADAMYFTNFIRFAC